MIDFDGYEDRGTTYIEVNNIEIYQPHGANYWLVPDKREGAVWEFDNLANALRKAETL